MGYVGKVRSGGVNHSVSASLFGYCNSLASEQIKQVTLPDCDALIEGMTIYVHFLYGNSAENPQMNVNGTGAAAIMRQGGGHIGSSDRTAWAANSIVGFLYDGENWVLPWVGTDTDTIYPVATQQANGLMSATDKRRLDGMNANIIAVSNVKTSTWASDSTYSGYTKRASITIAGCTAEYVPLVTFTPKDIIDYTLAPIAKTYTGGVYVYCAGSPGQLTVPSVILFKKVT